MLYFIPAWYQPNTWSEKEQYWYSRRTHTEFDDTVKQIQLFHRNGSVPYKILLLSYTPNFRHFLHRQSVYHAPYWSVFDCIQEVTRKKTVVFSYHNLDWPRDVEFVYSAFAIIAYIHDVKFAEIAFGEDGNPIEVSMFEHGKLARVNTYDDRGFVSRTAIYDNGELVYTDYLTPEGMIKLRVYASTGYVEVNQACNTYNVFDGTSYIKMPFKQEGYDNMGLLIKEVFEEHVARSHAEDVFCIAAHEQNIFATENIMAGRKYMLSFYGDRLDFDLLRDHQRIISNSSYVITDSEGTTTALNDALDQELNNVIDITPYDSRTDFGISEQLKVQKILVPMDGIEDAQFDEVIVALANYLTKNENARIHLFTREAAFTLPKLLLDKTAKALHKAGFNPDWAAEEEKTAEENKLDEEETEQVPKLFFVEQCVDELSVSRCIREQRIVLDMRENPDLYLQINCISTAIPQLVRRETQYIKNMANGLIINSMDEIPFALEYFLDDLTNWNRAKVFSYELAQKYTTRKLLQRWAKVMESIVPGGGEAKDPSNVLVDSYINKPAADGEAQVTTDMSWRIFWTDFVSDTYLYGSEIRFVNKNNVEFQNRLMPPGTIIKEWYSKTNYQAKRIEPALPIIDGESKYRIKINLDTPDDGTCLVRLVFYDRYEREAGDITIRDKEQDFTCPLKTYSYRLQLVNGGMTKLIFHSIIIEEIEDEKKDEEKVEHAKFHFGKNKKRAAKGKRA